MSLNCSNQAYPFAKAPDFVARRQAMQIVIAGILSADDLTAVQAELAKTRFVDGRETAGFAARKVKDNRQADAKDKSLDDVRSLVASRIMAKRSVPHGGATEGTQPAAVLAH